MQKYVLLLLSAFLFLCSAQSKDYDTAYFHAKENMLLEIHTRISTAEGANKKQLELAFRDSLIRVIQHPEASLHHFDSINVFGRVSTKNNSLIVYNWNIPQKGGFNNYYCIVQHYSKTKKGYKTTIFEEQAGFLNRDPKALATPLTWPGALYYEIIATKYKGKTFYTLLGFDFNNLLSNRKVIEVIVIDEFDMLVFEPNMFHQAGRVHNRIILEYNERVQTMLRYSENDKMIIYDHLSPMRPSMEGQFQFYGPDLSYDGFSFEGGVWIHQSNIQSGN